MNKNFLNNQNYILWRSNKSKIITQFLWFRFLSDVNWFIGYKANWMLITFFLVFIIFNLFFLNLEIFISTGLLIIFFILSGRHNIIWWIKYVLKWRYFYYDVISNTKWYFLVDNKGNREWYWVLLAAYFPFIISFLSYLIWDNARFYIWVFFLMLIFMLTPWFRALWYIFNIRFYNTIFFPLFIAIYYFMNLYIRFILQYKNLWVYITDPKYKKILWFNHLEKKQAYNEFYKIKIKW